MELMKNLKLFLCCLSVVFLSSCLDTMDEQDHAFVAKIKKHLKNEGDRIKVSEINQGYWSKVCFTQAGDSLGGDSFTSASEIQNIDKRLMVPMNRSKYEMEYSEFDWGIYFIYPPNGVEYFNIFNHDMFPRRHKEDGLDDYGCVVKDEAYFVAAKDIQKNEYRDNYLLIKLTRIEKGNEE